MNGMPPMRPSSRAGSTAESGAIVSGNAPRSAAPKFAPSSRVRTRYEPRSDNDSTAASDAPLSTMSAKKSVTPTVTAASMRMGNVNAPSV